MFSVALAGAMEVMLGRLFTSTLAESLELKGGAPSSVTSTDTMQSPDDDASV